MKIELGTPRIRPQIAFKMDQKSQIFPELFSKKNLKTFFTNLLQQSFKNNIAGIQKKSQPNRIIDGRDYRTRNFQKKSRKKMRILIGFT